MHDTVEDTAVKNGGGGGVGTRARGPCPFNEFRTPQEPLSFTKLFPLYIIYAVQHMFAAVHIYMNAFFFFFNPFAADHRREHACFGVRCTVYPKECRAAAVGRKDKR